MSSAEGLLLAAGLVGFLLYRRHAGVFRPAIVDDAAFDREDALAAAREALLRLGWDVPLSEAVAYPIADKLAGVYLAEQRHPAHLLPRLPLFAWSVEWREGPRVLARVWIGLHGELIDAHDLRPAPVPVRAGPAADPEQAAGRQAARLAEAAGWAAGSATLDWVDQDEVIVEYREEIDRVPVVSAISIRAGRAVRVHRYVEVPSGPRRRLERGNRRVELLSAVGLMGGMAAALIASAYWLTRWSGSGWPWAIVTPAVGIGLVAITSVSDRVEVRKVLAGVAVIGALTAALTLGGLGLAERVAVGGSWGTGVVLGVGVAGIWLGFSSWLYATGKRRGLVTIPASVSFDRSLPYAWLVPLQMGTFASLTEELTYRFVLTPALYVIAGWWVAILVPAFVWALPHVAYLLTPRSLRLFEVWALGCLLGAVALTWGIVPALVAHGTANSLSVAGGLPGRQATRGRLATVGAAALLGVLGLALQLVV